MLDLERFRLLKAMEDKNTPKKKTKFSATSEKKNSVKTPAKKKLRLWMEEKGPKKKNVHESHLCKGA